ncbi:MAG: LacI family transcriptional regulator [Sphingomonadales bacterium]|nr:LacI family transcriptional regulator [Sphingomonadales bacterium]
MTTISDVARLAGVGTTTVTKVLSGRKYVSESTRQRIYKAIAALDYQPSAAGRMLRTGVTHVLGVITPPPDGQPFTHYASFSRVLDGIGEVAGANGYDLLWITSADEGVGSYAALFKSKRVDGLIDLYIYPHDPRIDGLTASGYPFVLIGIPEDDSLPHVTAAHYDGGMLAGRAFARRGYAPVGYIGLADSPASRGRFAGLQAALAEVGQTVRPEHIGLGDRAGRLPDYEELGWTTMRRWLAHQTVPRAVLTAWDSTAYGVLRACREAGLTVPDDLAIVGFDDEPPSRLLTPPLATVRGPLRELGGAAATLLLQLIAGTAPRPPCQVLPMSFVERESLGPLP